LPPLFAISTEASTFWAWSEAPPEQAARSNINPIVVRMRSSVHAPGPNRCTHSMLHRNSCRLQSQQAFLKNATWILKP